MAEVSAAAVSWKEARLEAWVKEEDEVAAAEAGGGAVAEETGVGGTTAPITGDWKLAWPRPWVGGSWCCKVLLL